MLDCEFELVENLSNNSLTIKINGELTENATLPEPGELTKYNHLTIDLRRLSFINSSGLKRWILFTDELSKNDAQTIQIDNCPKIMINHINMIEGVLPKKASIKSFYVPYYCEKCDQSFDILKTFDKESLTKVQLANEINDLQYRPCPECGKNTEIDALAEQYFHFLET